MTDRSIGYNLDLSRIQEQLRTFSAERDWGQFHSPKNLAMALAAEAGELLEVFQWLTETESRSPSESDQAHAREELADVLIYLLRLADVLDVDLPAAIESKLETNRSKYPVDESKGHATKASRRGDS